MGSLKPYLKEGRDAVGREGGVGRKALRLHGEDGSFEGQALGWGHLWPGRREGSTHQGSALSHTLFSLQGV